MLRYVHTQTEASTTWTVQHNLDLAAVAVEVVVDVAGVKQPMIPATITKTRNTVTVGFSMPRVGQVIVQGSAGVVVDYAGFVQPVERAIDYTHSPTPINTTPPVTETPEIFSITMRSAQAVDNPNGFGYVEVYPGEEEWAYGSMTPAYPSVMSTNPAGSPTGLTRLGELKASPAIVEQGQFQIRMYIERVNLPTFELSKIAIDGEEYAVGAPNVTVDEFEDSDDEYSVIWRIVVPSNPFGDGTEHTITFYP